MYSNNARYAEMSVKLLLGEVSCEDMKQWEATNWKEFAKLAHKNLIMVRSYNELSRIGIKINEFEYSELVRLERERINKTGAFIGTLSALCRQEGMVHLFLKSLQHYPDMGHDIDLLIMDRSRKFDKILVKKFGPKSLRGNIVNLLSGKTDFILDSCPSSVEIHHGRIGHVGEHTHYPVFLMKNSHMVMLDDAHFPIPSLEDQLLIQTIQRIYCHFYVRISDLVCSIKLLQNRKLDWDYIVGTAKEINIIEGLRAYLSYVNEAHCNIFAKNIVPELIWRSLECGRYRCLTFRNSYYRYPMLSVTNKVYLNKIAKDVISGKFVSALRSTLISAVGLFYLAKNVSKRRSRYFD